MITFILWVNGPPGLCAIEKKEEEVVVVVVVVLNEVPRLVRLVTDALCAAGRGRRREGKEKEGIL